VAGYQGSDCVYETPASLDDGNDHEMSSGTKVGLGFIVVIAVGIFVHAGVMLVKNRPSSSNGATGDRVELVSGDDSSAL